MIYAIRLRFDLKCASLGKPVHNTLSPALLSLEVDLKDQAKKRSSFQREVSKRPLIDRQDVEALVHEQHQVDVEEFWDRDKAVGMLRRLERICEALCEPQHWRYVAHVPV